MKITIMIFLAVLLILLALIFFIQDFYVPIKNVSYKYSSTAFIEPSETFIKCFEDKDCIKVKGSACPPNKGGEEVCVDKDYFQEYLSDIEEKAGREDEVKCSMTYLVTNKNCVCIEGRCTLV